MKKSLITMLVALCLVAALGVGATLAYFTSTTGEVKNTFTIGNVTIGLTEYVDGAEKKTGFEYESVIPGQTYSKEPVVTVKANSEDCYLFVKVVNDNELITLENSNLNANGGWTALDGVADVYYRTVDKAAADTAFTLFDSVKISGDADENSTFTDITIQAYAIQKAGFETPAAGWAELNK